MITHLGRLNDLWRFNTTSNRFTWLSGSNVSSSAGVYGTQGVEASNNAPGGRSSMTCAYHARTNSIYVFGGWGYDSAPSLGTFVHNRFMNSCCNSRRIK